MSKLLDKKDNGVSQLISSKNTWAMDLWTKGCANHWMPQQVNMSEDIKQWKAPKFLSDDERLLVKRALGLFAAGESLVSNSIETGEWPYITDGAARQYMIRKNFEECLSDDTYCYSYSRSKPEWVLVKDIKEGNLILSFAANGSTNIEIVKKVHQYDNVEELVSIKTIDNQEILVSKDHRVILSDIRSAPDIKYYFIRAEALVTNYDKFKDLWLPIMNGDEKLHQVGYTGWSASFKKYGRSVYCVTVRSGAFVAKRGALIFPTGNSVHNWTVKVCCEAYNLGVEEVAQAYKNIPAIKSKERFLMKSLNNFANKDFDIETTEGKQKFLKNMVVFYLICEGTWFFSNFALLLAMGRQNKLPGLMDQIQYSLRDEAIHVEFGTKVLSQTQYEYPEVWTDEFKEDIRAIMKAGTEVEFAYARDVLPTGILGITPPMLDQYIKFLSNMRLKSIGLKPVYEECSNPFTWLGEAQDVSGMSAFFERHEKSYQHVSALTDDL